MLGERNWLPANGCGLLEAGIVGTPWGKPFSAVHLRNAVILDF